MTNRKQDVLVTLSPSIWRRLVAQATAHAREGGGLLIGRRVRSGIHVVEEVGMTHVEADNSHIEYDRDEVARARIAAYETYGPRYEPVGCWHTHPWPSCSTDALIPQITSGDETSDLEEMQERDIEIICATFPDPGYKPGVSEFEIRRKLAGVWCRAEVWLRVKGEAVPCRIKVRKVE